jgi:hypothetical protein
VCGATVPRGSRACPECGADERSGWDEDAARYDGLDLPPEPGEKRPRSDRTPFLWWVIAVILLIVLVGLASRLVS